tara:strand:+ start:202 stop:561 length:360 start_codon:yes stop_codon:yes gene_type:complete
MSNYQNNINTLPNLDEYRYENIFKLYQTGEKDFYYYNLIKKIVLEGDIDEVFFDYVVIPRRMPLTSLSFDIYGTMVLWWSILVVNKIDNPMKGLPSGEKIRYIKPGLIPTFVQNIKSQL